MVRIRIDNSSYKVAHANKQKLIKKRAERAKWLKLKKNQHFHNYIN